MKNSPNIIVSAGAVAVLALIGTFAIQDRIGLQTASSLQSGTNVQLSSPQQIQQTSLSNNVQAVGDIYVADYGNHRIQKFNSSGTYISQWGTFGTGNGQFKNERGIVINTVTGNIYVTDTSNNRIQVFNSSGAYINQWGTFGSGNGQFWKPYYLALGLTGNVYVADSNNHRIQVFSPNGTYISQWGTLGTGNGQFYAPCGVAVDSMGNVYVADTNSNRIQKFTSSGSYIAQWGTSTSPTGLAISPTTGNVYVTDVNTYLVEEFTSSGVPVTQWGSFGTGNGQFNHPAGIAIDPMGNVYVSDSQNNRIQKFTSSGTYLSQWGTSGTGNGQFISPYGIAIEPSIPSCQLTLTQMPLPTTILNIGIQKTLSKFKIKSCPSYSVNLTQESFTIVSSGNPAVRKATLYVDGQVVSSQQYSSVAITFNNTIPIPAGSTRIFELKGDVTANSGTLMTGDNLQTQLTALTALIPSLGNSPATFNPPPPLPVQTVTH